LHHRSLRIVLSLVAFAAFAQTGGTITGTIVDPDNAAVPNAAIQATNKATGAVFKTAISKTGAYSLSALPPGQYAVVVTALGFNAFSEDVNVTTAPTRLDIHMVEFQFGTLGDGREFQTDRMTPHKAPTSPTPRTADGKPDLTGVWYTQRIVDPGQPEMLPWAQKYFDEQAANSFRNAPGAHCLPRGITNAGALFPFRLVQTPTLLLMIFEDDIPSHRQVFLDGRGHPKDPNPMWMGHSIARWDGDTLVIDTVGFDERSWLDAQGHPHTDKMHVVERFHRIDLGHLEIEFTIDDPGAYKEPWVIKRATELDPNDDIGEYVCTENEKDVAHMK
jgi:hypothetical protein